MENPSKHTQPHKPTSPHGKPSRCPSNQKTDITSIVFSSKLVRLHDVKGKVVLVDGFCLFVDGRRMDLVQKMVTNEDSFFVEYP